MLRQTIGYIYQADRFCEKCGRALLHKLTQQGVEPCEDSDYWPQPYLLEQDYGHDHIDHCAAGAECLDYLPLSQMRLGAILTQNLSQEGVEWLISSIQQDPGVELILIYKRLFKDDLRSWRRTCCTTYPWDAHKEWCEREEEILQRVRLPFPDKMVFFTLYDTGRLDWRGCSILWLELLSPADDFLLEARPAIPGPRPDPGFDEIVGEFLSYLCNIEGDWFSRSQKDWMDRHREELEVFAAELEGTLSAEKEGFSWCPECGRWCNECPGALVQEWCVEYAE